MPGGMVVAPVVMSLGLGFVSWLMSVYGKQSGTLCLAERVKVLTPVCAPDLVRGELTSRFCDESLKATHSGVSSNGISCLVMKSNVFEMSIWGVDQREGADLRVSCYLMARAFKMTYDVALRPFNACDE
jgi:hypothetical protein